MSGADQATARVEHAAERPACEPARPQPMPGQYLAIALFVLSYWMVVGVWLQDVDLTQPPLWWQEQAAAFPLLSVIPTWLVSYVSTFASWAAARHILIPFVAGWWLANAVGNGFVQSFYNFPTRAEAARFLHRLQQQRSGGSVAASPRRLHPTMMLTLITAPFAFLFVLLIVISVVGPSTLRGSALYNALLVILGGVWFIMVVAYLLSQFMGDAPAPGLHLQRDTLDEMRKTQTLLRVGGPGRVIVGNSDAAITEYNGRFCRVLGPGAHRLRSFEYVNAVVDLRPQERHGEIQAMTRDGIAVSVDVSVTFRIDRDDRHFGDDLSSNGGHGEAPRPTKEQLYLFGRRAAAQAAYDEALVPDPQSGLKGRAQALLWSSRPLTVVAREFRQALSETPLIELFDPESRKQALHVDLLQNIRRDSRASLHDDGIELISLHLGPLRVREEILTQHLNDWRSYWQEQRIQEQEIEVQTTLVERARKEAEVMMLRAVLESIQEAQYEDGARLSRDEVARRLLQALDGAMYDLPPPPNVEEGEDVLERLRALHARLSPGDTEW
ncbi:MAG TPA: SPFH domain-containing protein [Candidatus Sulfomarinibacteraceae bacterium]|nr:SPFH domain-containing protein [Candidatus Sulfomarinibacteraceae bacterium]